MAERSRSAESRTSAERRGYMESRGVLERRSSVVEKGLGTVWRLGREKQFGNKSKPNSTGRIQNSTGPE